MKIDNKKMLLIYNPISGQKKPKKILLDIVSVFCEQGYECTTQITTQTMRADELVVKYGEGKDLIVCVGGDGTLNEVVSGYMLLKNKPKIGYIPTGTTNDFANSLRLPFNYRKGLKNILKENSRKVDVGDLDGHIFTYIASFGAFTKTSYSTPTEMKNSLGFLAYVLSGVKEIGDIRSYNVKINTDLKCIEGEYVFGGVCNSKRIGGVFKLPENVDINDGLLELFLIKKPQDPSEFMELLHDLNVGNYKSRMMEFFSIKSAEFIFNEDMNWTIDGEYYKGDKVALVKVIPDAFSICT